MSHGDEHVPAGPMLASLSHAIQLLQDGQLTLCARLLERSPSRDDLLTQRDPGTGGRGLLHWASVKGSEEIAQMALNLSPSPQDVDCPDDQGWTPLMLATSAGHPGVARLLLGAGADPNAVNATGQRPLHYAASKNRPELARILLASGAAASGGGGGGSASVTPLHRSCAQGHSEVTRLLLSNGAPVNACDSEGNTPLHYACEEGRVDDARQLIEAGANHLQLNKESKSPMDLMQSRPDRKQLELFAENVNR